MDPLYYTLNNTNIHCVIQEKDTIIGRQIKEIEDLHKTNQLLAKDNDKLRADLDLQKKLCEALEKFKYSLERHVIVLKDYDNNRWTIPDVESEVRIWEHEYLMIRKMLEKKERDEQTIIMASNAAANAINASPDAINQNSGHPAAPKQRRYPPKPKAVEVGADGTALKRYVCDFPNCSYRSNWAHDLKGHKRKHTGEKPYTCGWLNCNKSFRDLRDLKRHQRAHTGDKRYSCDWPGCEYRSTDVANLAKHKRTHTGERPYKCDWAGCEASFADGSHLRRHQKKHENQMTKLTKTPSTVPKRKPIATMKTSTLTVATAVKTRKQPGRRAKGSAQRSIDIKSDDPPEDTTSINDKLMSSANQINKTIDNTNESNGLQIDTGNSGELIIEMPNKSDIISNTTENVAESDMNLRLTTKQNRNNNNAVNCNVNSEPNQQNDNNQNLMNRLEEGLTRNDKSSSGTTTTTTITTTSDQQIAGVNHEQQNRQCYVITSTMMSDINQNINSSPQPQQQPLPPQPLSSDKQPIDRYSDMHHL